MDERPSRTKRKAWERFEGVEMVALTSKPSRSIRRMNHNGSPEARFAASASRRSVAPGAA